MIFARITTVRPLVGSVFVLAGSLLAAGAEDPERVAELREVIGQWVETERTITEERTAWQAEKESMAQLLELYREELALLDEELAEAGQSATGFDEKRQRLEGETAALRQARGAAAAALRAARTELLPLAERFPPPLRADVEEPVATLEAWKPEEELRPAIEALLRILDQANRFARSVTHVREVHDGREVEVIYSGLSHAYYLSAGGGAGLVVLTPTGWRWEERPELHKKIESVLAQLNEKSPPGLVRLPVPAPRDVDKP